MLRERWG